ncbi:MAG: four helix bundle protein [Planctomycetota bacterium]
MADVSSYKDLKVWQLGVPICTQVYALIPRFPAEERFGLSNQLRRCSVSISSNIAEGHARDTTRDYLRHLSIASGSLAELETQLTIAQELGFATPDELEQLRQQCEEESRMLTALRATLKKKLN